MKAQKREKHGMSRTPTYHTWAMMKQRCLNEKQESFVGYGGRSIAICERWQHSFVAFFEDMGEKPDGMSLDRIDNDGDYCPENCRWATPKEQANNTRRTRYITVDGKRRLAKDVARENGIDTATMQGRLGTGWTLEQAVGLEEHFADSAITIDGETMVMAQWAKKLGISRQAVDLRIKNGWDIGKALTTPRTDFSLRRGIPKGPRAKNGTCQLGVFIAEKRQELALTQKHLAERAGLSPATISHVETGRDSFPSMQTVQKLAVALTVPIDEITRLLPDDGIDSNQYAWYDIWKKGLSVINSPMNREACLCHHFDTLKCTRP